jgi:DNA-binding beta-propeller fold protein YncE
MDEQGVRVLLRQMAEGEQPRVNVAAALAHGRRRLRWHRAGLTAAPLCAVAAAALVASGVIPLGALTWQENPASAARGSIAYVGGGCGSGVTPVSVAMGKARKPIEAGPAIDEMVATPDGTTIYAASSSNDVVTPFSAVTGRVGRSISVGSSAGSVAGMAITPDGRTLYVLSTGQPGMVTPISTATNTAAIPIPIGRDVTDLPRTSPMAVTPNGKSLYVVNDTMGTVIPISTATDATGIPINTGEASSTAITPEASIAITPDGRTLYVASARPARSARSVNSGTVTPVSTATNKPGKPVVVAGGLNGLIAAAPDGGTVYAGTPHGLVPISTATDEAGQPVLVEGGPAAIAFTPDGQAAYVVATVRGARGEVVPISTATNEPGQLIVTTGSNARAIAIAPGGRVGYVANGGSNTVTPFSIPGNTAGKPIRTGGCPAAVVIER